MPRSIASRTSRARWRPLSFAFVEGIESTVYPSKADWNRAIVRAPKDPTERFDIVAFGARSGQEVR